MKKKFAPAFLVILSAVLTFIAIADISLIAGCLCFVPLLVSLHNRTPKQSFWQGFFFGFVFSLFAYLWMVRGAENFTGYSMIYGMGVFIICAGATALYWACLCRCVLLVSRRTAKSSLLSSIGIAALFCLFEFVWSQITTGMPWFSFYAGNAFLGNLYAVQSASLSGIFILSFFVVLINHLFSAVVESRRWKQVWIPLAVVCGYLLCGYVLLQSFTNRSIADKTITVATLAENISPDIKWDDANGNLLVQRLLDLNKKAVAQKPNLVLWSESAIPWTYRTDDDLVNEIMKESAPAKATHILGINTTVDSNVVNNSAYCLLPNGKVAGRYDKQFLLSFIEKPWLGVSIPFFSNAGFLVADDEEHGAPLLTPYGKAGMLICNEAITEVAARRQAKRGAQFLCNMSNDGWFADTYIVPFHFLNARLRAVETRKDIVVNCNNGYSGLIKADGNIAAQEISPEPFVQVNEIHPNAYVTLNTELPYLFISLCAAFLLFVLITNKFADKKTDDG